ncbi:alpha/beta hydrolase [Sphingomonas sp. PR090111-T3T-6A]|uniref:alpha/beta hydrolase n=1 Tax=Sphingomonas sp. PR090111-T3T-6A TaxID=685778 RepID=UPI00036D8E69|nr:alpha/beta fold hydrolase [Sphingomonas sp. PR090111-T3T-6A]
MKRFVVASLLLMSPAMAQAVPIESFIEAPGPQGPLKGTMLAPEGKGAPVVLILPGSGPTDRDGNSPLGIKASTYRLLAEGLAARGIASVRIDKRGLGGSAGAVADGNAVTMQDYATDTKAWVQTIRAKMGAPCLWLLGHSEGGTVALEAAQSATGICGLLLVSAPGRRLGEALRAQLHAGLPDASLLRQADSAIDTLEAGRKVDVSGMPPVIRSLFDPRVQGYLIDAMAIDPAKLAAAYKGPVLIVQGERDIQVPVADAQALKQAHPAAKLVLLSDTNHVLKTVASDARDANVATYADPSLPLAPGVVDAIAGFVSGR